MVNFVEMRDVHVATKKTDITIHKLMQALATLVSGVISVWMKIGSSERRSERCSRLV